MKDKEKTKKLVDEILELRRKMTHLQSTKHKNKPKKESEHGLSTPYSEDDLTLTTLLNAHKILLETDNFQSSAAAIIKKYMELTEAAFGYISCPINETQDNVFLLIDTKGKASPLDHDLPMPIQELLKEVYRTQNAIYHNNFSSFEWVELSTYKQVSIENFLMSPVLINSQVRGICGLGNKTEGFTDHDLKIAELLASNISVALQRSYEQVLLKKFDELKEQFLSISTASMDAIICSDSSGNIIFWNKAAENIFGYVENEILGKPVSILAPERFRLLNQDLFKWFIMTTDRELKRKRLEVTGIRKDGVEFPAELSLSMWEMSKEKFYTGIVRDITDRKKAEINLEANAILTAIEQSDDLMLICSINGDVEYVNKAMERITGYQRHELIGKSISLFNPGWNSDSIYTDIRESLLAGNLYNGIIPYRKKNGQLIEVFQSFIPIKDINDLNINRFAVSAKEITHQETTRDRLLFLAHYDSLTSLPNRSFFIDRTNQAIARIEYKKRLGAILVIDINDFKLINEKYGFETGDAILKKVGNILSGIVRECDAVARLDNDEFGISFIDIDGMQDIINLADTIIKKSAEPFTISNNEIAITVCIGISVYPEDGRDANEITEKAYVALFRAKQTKRKTYKFYTKDIDTRAAEIVQIEKNLFKSLKKDEFILYYQPYFEMSKRKIAGIETFVRWDNSELGMVSPGKFLPLLEETGMIIEVGRWILRSAIKQLREWKDNGYPLYPISVNLSGVQFRQKDLLDLIYREINRFKIQPFMLVLEITEETFIQDIEYSKKMLKNLKDIGVSISLDDFGTAYSSLGQLKNIPVDNLKIDISFIKAIAYDPDAVSIATTIITLAHNLNLRTIAEGVETEDQWKILKLLRCDLAQGHYLSKPLPPDEFVKAFLKPTFYFSDENLNRN
jgi:diguanylate cyclase (GGDEF)-like protein/PAS domain S-box-containing protein